MGAGALPAMSQQLLSLCDWVRRSSTELVVLAAMVTGAALLLRRRPELTTRLAGWLPVVGETLRRMAVAEFLEALALRLSAGSPPALTHSQAASAVGHPGFGAPRRTRRVRPPSCRSSPGVSVVATVLLEGP